MKNRKLKYGGMSLAFTGLFMLGLVLVNVLFGLLTERFYLKIDLTETKIYDITSDTIKILNDLPENVSFTILVDERSMLNYPYNIIHEILNKYETFSEDKLRIEYLNPNQNPGLAELYPALTLSVGDIIISSSIRYTSVNVDSLLVADSTGQQLAGIKAEQLLTAGVLYCLRENIPRAVFTQGHDELISGMNGFFDLLTKSQYQYEMLDISKSDLPDDTALVILCGPSADFLPEELEKLDRFMRNGGSCIYFANPSARNITNLNIYLNEWGISFENALVADTSDYISQYAQIYMDMVSEDLSGVLSSYGVRPITYYSMPINRLFSEKGSFVIKPVLTSSRNSYAKSFSDGASIASWDLESGDKRGPFEMAVLSEYVGQIGDGILARGYLFAATIFLADDYYVESSSFLNGQLIAALLSLFNSDEQSSQFKYIPAIDITPPVLTITGSQARLIMLFLVFILPLGIITAGFIMWFRRRGL